MKITVHISSDIALLPENLKESKATLKERYDSIGRHLQNMRARDPCVKVFNFDNSVTYTWKTVKNESRIFEVLHVSGQKVLVPSAAQVEPEMRKCFVLLSPPRCHAQTRSTSSAWRMSSSRLVRAARVLLCPGAHTEATTIACERCLHRTWQSLEQTTGLDNGNCATRLGREECREKLATTSMNQFTQ